MPIEREDKEKIEVIKIYKKDPYVMEKIKQSKPIYKGFLNKTEFEQVLVFPWNTHWGLFRMIKERRWCESKHSLNAFEVKDAAMAFLNHKIELDEYCNKNGFDDFVKLNELRGSILNRGYIDESKQFLVYEAINKSGFYCIDQHHRFIAYESLLLEGKITFKPLNCFFGEIKSINDLMKGHKRDMLL